MPQSRSLDFCNSFWGPNDGGVHVLFARMKGAKQTMKDFKRFMGERCAFLSPQEALTGVNDVQHQSGY